MDTITIAGDTNNALFAINITNDNVKESNETFQVKILPSVSINIGTPSSATVTIIDYYGEYATAWKHNKEYNAILQVILLIYFSWQI